MKLASYYPVIAAADPAETRDFYVRHFGFVAAFDSGWYVHLLRPDDRSVNLGIVAAGHDSVPVGHRNAVQGLLLNFELDDVDAEYERLKAAGVPILLPLRDEAWGQRHFIAADPNGVMIDVIKPIPPSPEFAAHYLVPSAAGA
jgi:catechol 2,3-dioxygenase-like lactoylglutathione lyase family enzyme